MRSLLLAVLLLGCSSPSRPAPVAPAPAPAPPPAPPPPIVVTPAPSLQRLVAGGLPGSTPHLWGTRFYELRRVAAGASGTALELRLHDEIHFQGVGMRPDQMPPTRHTCSPWETLPAAIFVPPSITSCNAAKAECAAIDAHLRATTPVRPADPSGIMLPDTSFGRGSTTCD